jgi:hypothetical protein
LNVDFGFVDVLVCCSIAQLNKMHNMLVDLFGDVPPADEQSTPFAKLSKKMVASAKKFVHDNQNHSNLSAISCWIAIRAQYSMPYYDDIVYTKAYP